MRVRRVRVGFAALAVGVAMTVVVSGIGVPENLVEPAAASMTAPETEPSVEGRAVPKAKVAKGAEETTPKVERRDPVWPTAGTAVVELGPVGKVAEAAGLPVTLAPVKGTEVDKVTVRTVAPEAVRKLGGVGIAAHLVRADGGSSAQRVRAQFSYAGFRDAFGGNFASRLQVWRLPVCVLEDPRPRSCVVAPTVVKAVNDLKAGTLTAEVEAAPAGAKTGSVVTPATPAKDTKVAAGQDSRAVLAAQLAAGSVYVLAGGLTGPDGNWGATDLKPSGSWQAGTSGGSFDYDLPLPEAPSPTGEGPGLSLQYDASSVDGQGRWTNNQSGSVGVGWDLNAGFIERRY